MAGIQYVSDYSFWTPHALYLVTQKGCPIAFFQSKAIVFFPEFLEAPKTPNIKWQALRTPNLPNILR